MGTSTASVNKWSQRFEQQGFDGLVDRSGRGRKAAIAPEVVERVIGKAGSRAPGTRRRSTRTTAAEVGISASSVSRFVAASDDHSSHPGYSAPRARGLAQRGGLGAVFAAERSRDALFDAMRARRTYATTGDRIILETSLNGTGMGQRAAYAEERRIEGRVIGTARDRYRHGIQERRSGLVTRLPDRYASDSAPNGPVRLELSFHSDATPGHWGDTPRGWRTWRGAAR